MRGRMFAGSVELNKWLVAPRKDQTGGRCPMIWLQSRSVVKP